LTLAKAFALFRSKVSAEAKNSSDEEWAEALATIAESALNSLERIAVALVKLLRQMSSLPKWVNKPIYQAQTVPILQINLASMYAACGIANSMAACAIARGVPEKPPAWVRFDSWAALYENSTPDEFQVLLGDIHRRSVEYAEEQRKRARALKNCRHRWSITHGVATKACMDCGRVEPVVPERKLELAQDAV
jgi:hypothetical protein